MSVYRVRSSNLAQFLSTFHGRSSRGSNDAERAKFEQSQASSVQKILTSVECDPKEKHVRNLILGTFHEEGSYLFWTLMIGVQLESNPIICWKFCYLFHRILRDGHKHVISDSVPVMSYMEQLGKFWSSLPQHYGAMIHSYCQLLAVKLNFHRQHSFFPGNLQISFSNFKATIGASADAYFDISASLLDYLDSILAFQSIVFKAIDQYYANSMTLVGQCRLRPLVPCIHEANTLYDLTVKTLFEMHNVLQASDLEGHRVRFNKCFHRLKDFYRKARTMQFFHNLIVIPDMPSLRISKCVKISIPIKLRFVQSTKPIHFRHVHRLVQVDNLYRSDCVWVNLQSFLIREPELILDIGDDDDDEDQNNSNYMNEYVTMESSYSDLRLPSPPQSIDSSINNANQLQSPEPLYAVPIRSTKEAIQETSDPSQSISSSSSVQAVIQQLNNLKTQMSEKDEVIRNLETRLSDLSSRQNDESSRKLDELNVQMSEKEEKYEKLKQVYSKLRTQHITVLKSEAQAKKDLIEANTKISEMFENNLFSDDSANQRNVDNNDSLIRQLEEQIKEIDGLRSMLEQNGCDLQKLRDCNKKLDSRVNELVQECERLSSELNNVRNEQHENVSLNERHRKLVSGLESKNNELSSKLQEVIEQNESLKALSQDNESLRKELGETRKLFEERDVEVQRLRRLTLESNENVKNEVEQAKSEMKVKISELNDELVEAKRALNQLKQEHEHNSVTLHRTESEKEKLARELENKQSIFNDVKSGKAELEGDLIDLLNEKEKLEVRLKEMESLLFDQEAMMNSLTEATLKAEEDAAKKIDNRTNEIAASVLSSVEKFFRDSESEKSPVSNVVRSIERLIKAPRSEEKCVLALEVACAIQQLRNDPTRISDPAINFKVSQILLCSKYDDKPQLSKFSLQLYRLIGRQLIPLPALVAAGADEASELDEDLKQTIEDFVDKCKKSSKNEDLISRLRMSTNASDVLESSLALYSGFDEGQENEIISKIIGMCV